MFMPLRYAVGLHAPYEIQVRVEVAENGEIKRVLHQSLDIEYPIVRVGADRKGEKIVIFKHPGSKRKYRIID